MICLLHKPWHQLLQVPKKFHFQHFLFHLLQVLFYLLGVSFSFSFLYTIRLILFITHNVWIHWTSEAAPSDSRVESFVLSSSNLNCNGVQGDVPILS